MNQESWGREEVVVRVAISLKGLEEFKDKDLNELIDTACYLVLTARERIPIAERNYAREKQRAAKEAGKLTPHAEVAVAVTGQSNQTAALERFNRFYEALPKLEGVFTIEEQIQAHAAIKNGLEKGYRKEVCDLLADLYPRWWKSEQSRLQSERVSQRYKKSLKKDS
jgi:hypothetical protein